MLNRIFSNFSKIPLIYAAIIMSNVGFYALCTGEDFTLMEWEVCEFWFDHAGYSDGFYYGESLRHDFSRHEVLSGEWAAAIYWDQLLPFTDADWLTDRFYLPEFTTETIFIGVVQPQWDNLSYNSWDDPENPIEGIDTAQAILEDDLERTRITIDYEIVDLGQQDISGVGGSPIAFVNNQGKKCYVNSERYVCLQTYTITNISGSTITGLEFYQMLHAHPANNYNDPGHWDFGPNFSTYLDMLYDDPLQDYIPYNSVHKCGNFKYDIAQWNTDPGDGHVDWCAFSCVDEPDFIDNDLFEGHSGKPTSGTYTHIEQRSLNNLDSSQGQVAGAMQWNLDTLNDDESKSVTVAIMFGFAPINEAPVTLTKTDNLSFNSEVNPPEIINYEIFYDAAGHISNNVVLVDELPTGVTYNTANPATPPPDEINGSTLTWNIGNFVTGNESGTINLPVTVTDTVEPGSTIKNKCYMQGDSGFYVEAYERTKIGCYQGNVLYVNDDADPPVPPGHDGLSWDTAFDKLEDALAKCASNTCFTEIWIAEDTYTTPTEDPRKFILPDGVTLYGGFPNPDIVNPNPDLDDRNTDLYVTTLTGSTRSNYIIWADSVFATLDGLRIADSPQVRGVYVKGSGLDLTITDCIFENLYEGIWQRAGISQIRNSTIRSNPEGNIVVETADTTIDGCIINNSEQGVYVWNANAVVKNSIITNHTSHADSSGLYNYSGELTVQGCTIAGNRYGIYTSNTATTTVHNSILWGNTENFNNNDPDLVEYSCIQGGYTGPGAGDGIISDDPLLTADYHIQSDSPCKDYRDVTYSNETDIDGEPRTMPQDGLTDIGADEVGCLSLDADEYDDWAQWGFPDCWCYQRQCRGDATGTKLGFWVQSSDLTILKAAWYKSDAVLAGVTNGICADFNHAKLGFRVQSADLNILKAYWYKVEALVPCCDNDQDCVLDASDKYNFWTN